MKSSNTFEPTPRWVLSVKDLSPDRSPGLYRVTPWEGEPFEVVVKDRKRQVVDTLIETEVYCASTVRIGDAVFRLKEDNNLHAETKTLSNGRKYYTLEGRVTFLGLASTPKSEGVL